MLVLLTRHTWKNGQWGQAEVVTSPYVNIHISATGLHYGQSVFEGLKAFRCKDGKIRVFRPDQNARRMKDSAERILMPAVPQELFLSAVKECILRNLDYVPSYEHGGSLYIRPILFGSGARVPPEPSDEYVFIVFVLPVGDYYAGTTAVSAVVVNDHDRAAPLGVGDVKVAGNYAASLQATYAAKKQVCKKN